MMMMMVMSVVLATVHRIVNATRSHDKKAFASLSVLRCGYHRHRHRQGHHHYHRYRHRQAHRQFWSKDAKNSSTLVT